MNDARWLYLVQRRGAALRAPRAVRVTSRGDFGVEVVAVVVAAAAADVGGDWEGWSA